MSNLSSAGNLSVSGNFSCVGNVNLSGQLTSSADGYFNSITTSSLNSATLQVSGDATFKLVVAFKIFPVIYRRTGFHCI